MTKGMRKVEKMYYEHNAQIYRIRSGKFTGFDLPIIFNLIYNSSEYKESISKFNIINTNINALRSKQTLSKAEELELSKFNGQLRNNCKGRVKIIVENIVTKTNNHPDMIRRSLFDFLVKSNYDNNAGEGKLKSIFFPLFRN